MTGLQNIASRWRGSLNMQSYVGILAALLLGVLVLYPLGILLVRSLGGDTFTLEYFEAAFSNKLLRTALVNSIIVSVSATLLATILGMVLAFMTHRAKFALAGLFDILVIIPFFISPLVIALSWNFVAGPTGLFNILLLALFGESGPQVDIRTLPGISIILGLYLVPYTYLYTSIGLRNIDPSFEEASYTHGGSTLRTALRVTLPLATPSILSGMLMAFVLAVSHFSIPLVLGRPHGLYVMTTVIYDLVRLFPPEFAQASAVSFIALGFTAVAVWGQRTVLSQRSYAAVIGKARAVGARRGGGLAVVAFVTCAIYVLIVVVIPILTLIAVSFMRFYSFDTPLFTLKHYSFILTKHPATARAIRNSLLLATVGATMTVLFTAVLGYVIVRSKGRVSSLLDVVAMVPIAIPATSFAVALLAAWLRVPFLYGTLIIMLIAYITIYVPFGVRSASANLTQINQDLEEVSRTSGAGWGYTFRRIIIPLLRPGLTAAWVILFVGMLKEVSTSVLLFAFGTETFSVVMVELWSEGSSPLSASLAIIQTLIIVLVVVIFRRLTRADLRMVA